MAIPKNPFSNLSNNNKTKRKTGGDLPDISDLLNVPNEGDYAVDPKTGLRYKKIKGAKSGNFKDMQNAEYISDLRALVEQDESFNSIDAFSGEGMDEMAKLFIPHLRVPPNKEEIEKLRKQKIAQQLKQEAEYNSKQAVLKEKYDKDVEEPYDFSY